MVDALAPRALLPRATSVRIRTKRPADVTRHTRVVAVAREGVHATLLAHKKAGHHIVVVEDGKMVRIPPQNSAV